MIFFVNRPDGEFFAPADEIDPKYGASLREAAKHGVEIFAIRAMSTLEDITTGEMIPLKF